MLNNVVCLTHLTLLTYPVPKYESLRSGAKSHFVRQRYLNFCIKSKNSKKFNTTQQTATVIWRMSTRLNIPAYPEFAKEQTNKGTRQQETPFQRLNITHINNERAANNMNNVPEI